MATYDDGLYTPWGEAGTPVTPVAEATIAAAVEPTYEAPSEAPPSSTYVYSEPEPTPTYVYVEPTSSYVWVEPTSSWTPLAETSTAIPTTSSSLQSSTRTSSSSSQALSRPVNLSTTLSRPALNPTGLADSASQHSFKIVWLTPVFVLLPIIIAFAVAGCLYGRCWGHRASRRREQSGSGGGWFGEGSMRGERGILSPEEEGWLVEGKWVGDDEDEKYVDRREPGWRGFAVGSLSRGGRNVERESQFQAVPYASLEEPFLAPGNYDTPGKNYLTPSAEDHSTSERGWTWGTKPVSPDERRVSKGQGSGWQWPTKRYRAKSASSKRSTGSSFGGKEREDSTMGRWRSRAGLDSVASPSLYSPTFENGQEVYQGFRDRDDDDEVDEMLAESRTGHGNERARRFMSGTEREDDFPTATSRGYKDEPAASELGYAQVEQRSFATPSKNARERRHVNDGFRIEVELPANLPPTHNSPTKSAVLPLVRPPPPITPTKAANLLFSYDSPASATRAPRSPLPVPPPRRNIPAPQFREAQPDPFFHPPSPINVGGPMPPFKSDAIRASESAYSLTGVRGLVFGDDEEEEKKEVLVETKEERATRKLERAERKEAKRRSRAEVVVAVEEPAAPSHKVHRVSVPAVASAPFTNLLPALKPSGTAPPHVPIPPPHRSSLPPPQHPFIPASRAPLPRPQSVSIPAQRTTPSRVRNQVDALELAHASSPPPSPSRPSLPSPARAALPHASVPVGGIMPGRESAPVPKLARSATLLERQKEEEEQRRIGKMLVQRSKTLSRIVVESPEEEQEPVVKKRRPLSEGAGLSSAVQVEEERRRMESFGTAGKEKSGGSKVRGMDAMVRRSIPAGGAGLKSAMKGGRNDV